MKSGIVYTDKGFKAFKQWRPIGRGRHQGQVAVQICKATKTGIRYVERVVAPAQIKRYPEAE